MAENIKIVADREDIVAIANAVRNKIEATKELTLGEIVNGINGINTGVDLPELSNEGSASELFSGKEFIDGEGNKVTGTFTIAEELTTQDNLISQIQTALQNKASISEPTLQIKTAIPTTSPQTVKPDSGYDGLSKVTVEAIPSNYEDVAIETNEYTTKLASLETAIVALESELEGKASGGGSGGANVETCTLEIVNNSNLAEMHFCVTRFVDGSITDNDFENYIMYKGTKTVTNVVCNSGFGIFIIEGSVDSCEKMTIIEDGYIYKVSASAGETARITVV